MEVEGSLPIEADVVLFEQVLCNLFDNAVKYASNNSTIRVIMGTEGISFVNSCEEDLSAVLGNLCEPFVVGDASRGNRKGSGLGLAIAKNICELHGFSLEITYKEGSFEARVKI